jgi:glycosyltransferase involved in cell wall biosynthesis
MLIPRVAIVFEYGTLSGGERSILAAIDPLRGSTFEFVAVAPAIGPLADALRHREIRQLEFCCFDAAGTRLPRERLVAELGRVLDDANPDVVHANSLSMGRLLGAAASVTNVSTVAHLRDIVGLSRSAVDDLNRNHVLLAVSRATRDFHVAQGLDAARTRIVYNGVDGRIFCPRPAAGALRGELRLPDNAFLVLTVGQIGPRKGWDVLAEAAHLAQGRLPDVHYVLVGERNSAKDENIECERAVVARFAVGALAGRAHWLGRRADVATLMDEADLLVHPARQEPLGRVLLEAAASGLPIIATNVGGTPEILEDGVSARLITPNDAKSFANALAELHDDGELRSRYAAAARQRAEQQFSVERAAGEIAEIWRQLADS